jgi:hypothetical protein
MTTRFISMLGCLFFLHNTATAQNVGIGTDAPTSKLHVNGQIAIDQKNFGGYGGLLIKGNAPGSNYPNICLTIKNNAANPADVVAGYIGGNINNNTAGNEAMDLTFMTSRNGLGGLTERLLIKDNGNIGIGTSTPGFPLSFANSVGDKISLYGNSGNHYGFGIQGGLLQIYSDAAGSNIALGYGASGNFTERMRIINNGGDAVSVNGRMILRNGTSPLDINYGSGLWLYKADNSGLLGFMGVQNNQNIGFYGGPAGWGFTYDAINSRLGINTPVTLNGNAGNTGEVLTSNGTAAAPAWSPATRFIYDNSVKKISTSFASVGGAGNPTSVVVPDLSHSITVSRKVMAMITWNYLAYNNPCAFCGDITLFTAVLVNGAAAHQLDENIGNGSNRIQTGSTIMFLDPGTYTIELVARNFSSNIVASVGGNGTGILSNLCVVLFPQ